MLNLSKSQRTAKKKRSLILASLLVLFFAVFWGGRSNTTSLKASTNLTYDRPPSGPFYTITFDDGLESVYQIGLPIIEAAGYKTTQFIITGMLGSNDSTRVTEEQILAMQKRGHEIGSHTRTHPRLPNLSPEGQRDEIVSGYRDLCALLLRCPTSFAYPYGAYDDSTVSIVKAAGFTSARMVDRYSDGTVPREPLNVQPMNQFVVIAYPVTGSTSIDEVKSVIDSAQSRRSVWLVFLLHGIDDQQSYLSVKHEFLQQMVDYLKQKNAAVITESEGVSLLGLR